MSKEVKKILFIILFPIGCLLFNIFSNLSMHYNALIGCILFRLSLISFILFILILCLWGSSLNIKKISIKEFLGKLFLIAVFIFILCFSNINIIDPIKDCFLQPKTVLLKEYNIDVNHQRRSRNPIVCIVTGYDANGNKYKLESSNYIYEKEGKIKITYYKNIKMIKSVEYYK